MALERTFSIIKPDATRRNLTGKINAKFEEAGLRIVAQKRIHLTMAQAGEFYAVHKERPFYGELCEFMASLPLWRRFWKAKAPLPRTVKSWAQPIPQMPPPAPSAQSLPNPLVKTPCMAQMRPRLPHKRLPISFPVSNWLAKQNPLGFQAAPFGVWPFLSPQACADAI